MCPPACLRCLKAINNFQTIVKQLQKNASTIKSVVDAIASVELIRKPTHLSHEVSRPQTSCRLTTHHVTSHHLPQVPEMSELADDIEKHRLSQLEELKRQYTQIGPLLIKVEEMVVNTNTGRSPRMAGYYAYWEEQIFAALNKMVLSSLSTCLKLLAPRDTDLGASSSVVKAAALFRVTAVLSAPEVPRPSPNAR